MNVARIILFLLAGSVVSGAVAQTTQTAGDPSSLKRRQDYLRQLDRVLPSSQAWKKWLEKSGELPPDFKQLPSHADLPNPLLTTGGARVTDAAQWAERRKELIGQFEHWFWGSVPPVPADLKVETLEQRADEECETRLIRLSFGPGGKASFRVELLIPRTDGPKPVFMTQANHRTWAQIAVTRGYVGCVYNGSDGDDDTESFAQAFPEHDWSTLRRRAYAASRCVDYLLTIPDVADAKRIAIVGHSRNGKQSLIAGASDERFAVVIGSSSGQGGSASARMQGEPQAAESLEALTRAFPDWLHPRARFFAGREDKLPVDFHEQVALCAPRACLISTALNDPYDVWWAEQQTYLAVKPTYELLGAPDKLRILWRSGGHETQRETIERYLDFCDRQFGRGNAQFPERLPLPIPPPTSTQAATSPANRTPEIPAKKEDLDAYRAAVRKVVIASLGQPPPQAPSKLPGSTYGHEPSHTAELLRRYEATYAADLQKRNQPVEGVDREAIVIGDYISADVYMPAGLRGSGRKVPAVLWLHPFAYSKGYASGTRRDDAIYRNLAQRGFVVLCYDQIGFGGRVAETERFYERYPRWTLMGQMVRDAHDAIDALLARSYVDPNKVYLVGHSLGAFVGLHVAAIEGDRLAGAALASPPPPYRTDSDVARTGGLRRWSEQTALLPPLGAYVGREAEVPYDLPDLVACFAPKPMLLITPQLSRHAPLKEVTAGIDAARKAYDLFGAGHWLSQRSPESFDTFDTLAQTAITQWLPAPPELPKDDRQGK